MAYIKVKASLRAWKYDRSATRQEYILDVYRKLGTDSAMAYIKVKASLRAWKHDRSATRQEYILSVGETKQT
jgi:hypothetical protein